MFDRRTFLTLSALSLSAINMPDIMAATVPRLRLLPHDRITHFLSRFTFGATPDLYEYVQQVGLENYIEQQLNPENLDDSRVDSLLEDFPLMKLSGGALIEASENQRGRVLAEFVSAWLLRALYSERQLYERMVHFWSDHFHTSITKGPVAFLKIDEDRNVIRPHALGAFREVLGASAHSPAMLVYLDNAQSNRQAPNENYARELMELHTLGVSGGYSETDVKAVARAFTGWSVTGPRDVESMDEAGQFVFRDRMHDKDAKSILGHALPARQGIQDGETVLNILASHPSTALFVSEKLVRRFVSDDPPLDLVNAVAQTFQQTGGDTRAMLQTILASDAFWDAPPKYRRPFEYTVSVMRALSYQIENQEALFRGLRDALDAMGHIPFAWAAPNGYPDHGAYWMSGNLLPRWNLVVDAFYGNQAGGPDFDRLAQFLRDHHADADLPFALGFLSQYLYGRALTDEETSIVIEAAQEYAPDFGEQASLAFVLLLAGPNFQFK